MKNKQIIKKLNILIAPDKFRDSLTASQVCDSIEQTFKQIEKQTQNFKFHIKKLQLADGGQGSLNILYKYLPNVTFEQIQAFDPLMRKIKTRYLIDQQRQNAYIQMAQISGLSLLKQYQRNPLKTTTYGVGQIILNTLNQNIKKINIFIGGSATNDGGIGMAAALGYKFLDKNKNYIQPIGQNLKNIHQIMFPSFQIMQKINKTDIFVVSDVQNLFFGENGAAYVYAPQKGANKQSVQILDQGLRNLNQLFKNNFKKDLSQIKGSGAAGGLGGGAIIFLNAKMQKGIQKVLQFVEFEQEVKQSNLIITGQGKIDKQSLQGKVINGVINKVKKFNKPLWIICGVNEFGQFSQQIKSIYQNTLIISLVRQPEITKQVAMKQAYNLVKLRIKQFLKKQFEEKS